MDWFLYDIDLGRERVKVGTIKGAVKIISRAS